MTTAQLVNLILDKLRTGRAEFLVINNRPPTVRFSYAGIEYTVLEIDNGGVEVYRWSNVNRTVPVMDNYQKWMEGVLNGKTRDESGVLA